VSRRSSQSEDGRTKAAQTGEKSGVLRVSGRVEGIIVRNSSNLVLTGPIDEDDPASPRLRRTSARRDDESEGESCQHRGDRPAGHPVLKETLEIPSLPVHFPILGTSTFSIPEKPKRAVTVGGGAPKMNRRRLPVVCVRFPKPFHFLAHQAKNSNWRRGRDSNPRYPFGVHSISSAAPSATRSPLRRESADCMYKCGWQCMAKGPAGQC
jgi:hypothetical protein